jgi:hypothetical protein
MSWWLGTRNGLVAPLAVAIAAVFGGCGGSGVDSGGLGAGDRDAAQAALTALDGSNVSTQLVSITNSVQSTPAACRVHLASRQGGTFSVYVFWIPWLGSESYTWLNMSVAKNPAHDTFDLGTEKPVLPGGVLSANGRSVDPYSQDTTLLSKYGPAQAEKSRELLEAHAAGTFAKPGAGCQVLMNGDLRLVPNS